MNFAIHAVKVAEIKVRRHAEKYVRRDLNTILAERRVVRRLTVNVLGHEEQPVDLTVDRGRRVATLVLDIDLHDTTMSRKDVAEVRLPAIAVEPDARRCAVATAAESHLIKKLEVVERQFCC